MYYTTLGLIVFVAAGSLVSICTGRVKSQHIDDKLLGICFKRTPANAETEIMLQAPDKT